MESSVVVSNLMLAAFGLMVAVTGGIAYLTLADWRDRRRQEVDKRVEKSKGRRR